MKENPYKILSQKNIIFLYLKIQIFKINNPKLMNLKINFIFQFSIFHTIITVQTKRINIIYTIFNGIISPALAKI